jgi:inorganic pyrophosphatase
MDLANLPAMITRQTFRVVVESPRGSTVKLKFDPKLGVMTLSRPLTAGVIYPFDWGFVPGTRAADGDPLDAIVVWDTETFPGVVLPCRALGVVLVDQRDRRQSARQRNDRLVALPTKSPRFDHLHSVRDLPRRIKEELEAFFLAVTALEHKDVRVLGWQGVSAALRLIKQHEYREGARPSST